MAPKKLLLQLDQNGSTDQNYQPFLPSGSLEFPNIEDYNLCDSFQEESEREKYYEYQDKSDKIEFDQQENSQKLDQIDEPVYLDNIIEYQEVEVNGRQSPVVANKIKSNDQLDQQESNLQSSERMTNVQQKGQQKFEFNKEAQEGLGIDIEQAEAQSIPSYDFNSRQKSEFTKAVPVPPTSKLKGKKFEFPTFEERDIEANHFQNSSNNKIESKILLQIPSRKQTEYENQNLSRESLKSQEMILSDEDSKTNKTISVYSDQQIENEEIDYQNVSQKDQTSQDSFQQIIEKLSKPQYYQSPTSPLQKYPTSEQQDFNNSNTRSVHEKMKDYQYEIKELKSQNTMLRSSLEEFKKWKETEKRNLKTKKENSKLEEYKCLARRLLAIVQEREQKLKQAKDQQKQSSKELNNLYLDLVVVKEALEEFTPLNVLQFSAAPKSIKNEITQKIYLGMLIMRNTQCINQAKLNKLEKENKLLIEELQNAKEANKILQSEQQEIISTLKLQIETKEAEMENLQQTVSQLMKVISSQKEEGDSFKINLKPKLMNSQVQKANNFNQIQSKMLSLKQNINIKARANSPVDQLQMDSQQSQAIRSKFLRDLEQKTMSITYALQNLQTTKNKEASQFSKFKDIVPNTTKGKRIVSVSPNALRKPPPKAPDQHRRQTSTEMNQEISKSTSKDEEEQMQMSEVKKLYPHTFRLSPKLAKELAIEDMKRKYSPI